MNIPAAFSLACFLSAYAAPACGSALERIVFVRHGEKPPKGLGQLDCQGLNRALALPSYFARAFGKPDVMLAPDPGQAKKDSGQSYDYVRPLITIEPTAIAFGLPVNAHFGFDDVRSLEKALDAPELQSSLVLVAWEHRIIDQVARDLLSKHGGDPAQVKDWGDNDFDSVYVVTIEGGHASFSHLQEGLNGQSATCP